MAQRRWSRLIYFLIFLYLACGIILFFGLNYLFLEEDFTRGEFCAFDAQGYTLPDPYWGCQIEWGRLALMLGMYVFFTFAVLIASPLFLLWIARRFLRKRNL